MADRLARSIVCLAAIALCASPAHSQTAAAPDVGVGVTIQKLSVIRGLPALVNQVGDQQIGDLLFRGMIYADAAPDCATNPGVFSKTADVNSVMPRMLLGLSSPPSDAWAIEIRLVSATAEEIAIAVKGKHKKFDAAKVLQDVGSRDFERTLRLRPGQPQLFFGKADASADTACAFDSIQYQIIAQFVAAGSTLSTAQPPR